MRIIKSQNGKKEKIGAIIKTLRTKMTLQLIIISKKKDRCK